MYQVVPRDVGTYSTSTWQGRLDIGEAVSLGGAVAGRMDQADGQASESARINRQRLMLLAVY
jgi:hypothetical protein